MSVGDDYEVILFLLLVMLQVVELVLVLVMWLQCLYVVGLVSQGVVLYVVDLVWWVVFECVDVVDVWVEVWVCVMCDSFVVLSWVFMGELLVVIYLVLLSGQLGIVGVLFSFLYNDCSL